MRQVKLTRYANTHLAYTPGSEVALASALAKIILDKGLAKNDYLAKYVGNVDELKSQLAAVDLKQAAAITGLSEALLEEAATYLGAAQNVALVLGADVIRSAGSEDKVLALANLALLCGSVGSENGGVFPIGEKGNMQGLLDMGVAADLLPGFKEYAKSRAEFEKAWGASLPAKGLDAQGITQCTLME